MVIQTLLFPNATIPGGILTYQHVLITMHTML